MEQKNDQAADIQRQQRAANQALLNTVADQRNAAMNQLAQASASLQMALAEVDRLNALLAAKDKPKRQVKKAADAAQ